MYSIFAAANIQSGIDKTLNEYSLEPKKIVELGFWPGETVMEIQMCIQILPYRCQNTAPDSLPLLLPGFQEPEKGVLPSEESRIPSPLCMIFFIKMPLIRT